MKDGFLYHGAEINTMGGSFGRVQSSAQWGKQIDSSPFMARSRDCTTRFRTSRNPLFAALYGDVGYGTTAKNSSELWGLPDNKFGATATAAGRVAAAILGRDLTTPQIRKIAFGLCHLTGKVEPR